MRSWLTTLVIALVIPIMALALVSAAGSHLDTIWRGVIENQLGPITDAQFDRGRLTTICKLPDTPSEMGEICGLAEMSSNLRIGAIVAMVLSLALVALIGGAHLAARRDRRRLAQLFAPGLYVVLGAVILLTILDGALVVAGAYVVETVYFNVAHIGLILPVGFAVALAVVGIIRATFRVTRRLPLDVKGVEVDRKSQPRLFAFLDSIAAATGGPVPHHVLVGLDPTFFVTEADVTSIDGPISGRTLFVSAPLMHALTQDEFGAVVGHELGHFLGEDATYSRKFYPIYRGSIGALIALNANAHGLSSIPLLPPLKILSTFFESFAMTERGLSRDRELAADQVGAEAVSPEAISTSLVKLNLYTPTWDDTLVAAMGAIQREQPIANLPTAFASRATPAAGRARFPDLESDAIRHPFDTHPDLATRLAAFDFDANEIAEDVVESSTTDLASDLLDDAAALEERLTAVMNQGLSAKLERFGLGTGPRQDGAVLREAATTDPVIAAAIEFVEGARGGLQAPPPPPRMWMTMASLETRVHPEPRPFNAIVSDAHLPPGDQLLISGPASARSPAGSVIPVGTAMQLVGVNDLAERRAGIEENYFAADGRLLVVRRFGDWPIAEQLAGILVLPGSDPFMEGARGEEAADLRDACWTWQPQT